MMSQPDFTISGLLPHQRAAYASRRDVRAIVAMLGLFGLGLGALVVYTHSFMSMPAEIGLERSIDPSPLCSHERRPPSAANTSPDVQACVQRPYPR